MDQNVALETLTDAQLGQYYEAGKAKVRGDDEIFKHLPQRKYATRQHPKEDRRSLFRHARVGSIRARANPQGWDFAILPSCRLESHA